MSEINIKEESSPPKVQKEVEFKVNDNVKNEGSSSSEVQKEAEVNANDNIETKDSILEKDNVETKDNFVEKDNVEANDGVVEKDNEVKENVLAKDIVVAKDDVSLKSVTGQVKTPSKNKVDIYLQATANTPIIKTKKWAVDQDKTVGMVIKFLKKYLQMEPNESLFLYVNQSFAPSPDQLIKTLSDCYSTDGTLILYYCKTQAWG